MTENIKGKPWVYINEEIDNKPCEHCYDNGTGYYCNKYHDKTGTEKTFTDTCNQRSKKNCLILRILRDEESHD